MSRAGVSVRRAVEADGPVILNMIRELAEYERLSHLVTADEQALGAHLFGPRPYAEALIAEFEGEPCGYALFFHTYSTFVGEPGVYLEDLFVPKTFRGRGAGMALLRAVAAVAVERGCARLEWAVLDWNEPAVRFYEAAGGNPLSDWTTFRLDGSALAALADLADPGAS